jgi:hypothetical protein
MVDQIITRPAPLTDAGLGCQDTILCTRPAPYAFDDGRLVGPSRLIYCSAAVTILQSCYVSLGYSDALDTFILQHASGYTARSRMQDGVIVSRTIYLKK